MIKFVKISLLPLMVLCSLSACATFEGEEPQSPAVRAAKSCMKHLKSPMKNDPVFHIDACTNTGVWMVKQNDPESGLIVAEYDFVNRLYAGSETGGSWLPIESVGGYVEQNFTMTQKTLNAALLQKE